MYVTSVLCQNCFAVYLWSLYKATFHLPVFTKSSLSSGLITWLMPLRDKWDQMKSREQEWTAATLRPESQPHFPIPKFFCANKCRTPRNVAPQSTRLISEIMEAYFSLLFISSCCIYGYQRCPLGGIITPKSTFILFSCVSSASTTISTVVVSLTAFSKSKRTQCFREAAGQTNHDN